MEAQQIQFRARVTTDSSLLRTSIMPLASRKDQSRVAWTLRALFLYCSTKWVLSPKLSPPRLQCGTQSSFVLTLCLCATSCPDGYRVVPLKSSSSPVFHASTLAALHFLYISWYQKGELYLQCYPCIGITLYHFLGRHGLRPTFGPSFTHHV